MVKNPNLLGIEIGGTKLQIVIGNADARILSRHRFAVDKAKGGAGIRRQLQKALKEIVAETKIAAVGVGFGGPVHWRTGKVALSHHIEGWEGFPLARWLEGIVHAPVLVDNDANVAALGEATHGAGRGANPVFYVTLGSGVGGGLVVDGRIYHGAAPGECEIGHVRLDRAGTIVESRCSGWSVDARIRALKKTQPTSLLCKMMEGEIRSRRGNEADSVAVPEISADSRPPSAVLLRRTGRRLRPAFPANFLAAAVRKNDAAAKRILNETAADLAFGLSHVVQLLHPEVIVLGGGLSLVGEPLRAAVTKALRPFVMHAFAPGPRVCLALGEDVVPVGALELARAGRVHFDRRDTGR